MTDSMLALMQRHGYAGTGLNAVLEHSGAPKGSMYFHFPGGKEELGVHAVALAGEQWAQLIKGCLDVDRSAELEAVLGTAMDAMAELMVASDYAAGCPVSVVTLEMGNESEALRSACIDAYDSWVSLVEEFLIRRGVQDARQLASASVSLIEGALIISRARRSPEPLRDAGKSLVALLRSAEKGL